MISARQRKAADRVGGIELILPYPADLHPPDINIDEECDATPAEHQAAVSMLGDISGLDLVPVRVQVVRLRQAGSAPIADRPIRHWLAVIIIGRRWVHSSTHRRQKVMWSEDALRA